MKRFLAMLIGLLFLAGCAGVNADRVRARAADTKGLSTGSLSTSECIRLMGQRDAAEFFGKVLAGSAGASALGSAPEQLPQEARWGIAAGAAGMGAVAVGLIWLGERKGEEFETFCEVVGDDD